MAEGEGLSAHTWDREPHRSRPRGAATAFLCRAALPWPAKLPGTFQGEAVCKID